MSGSVDDDNEVGDDDNDHGRNMKITMEDGTTTTTTSDKVKEFDNVEENHVAQRQLTMTSASTTDYVD